jgi:hypothetical protein
MTTYGVSADFKSPLPHASLYSLLEDKGPRCAVYDEGMDFPPATENMDHGLIG